MSKSKQLAVNTAIITIGKISTQFISFFLLPVYTKLLTTSDYGVVDLLGTLVSLLVPIIILQIEQAAFRYLIDYRNNSDGIKKVVSTTIAVIVVQSIVFIFVFCLFEKYIHNSYKVYLLINVLICIFSSVLSQIARGLGNNLQYALSSFLAATVTIILNIIFIVFLNMGASGMLLANFISNLFVCLYLILILKLYKYIRIKKIDLNMLKELLKYSLPLIPNSISWWIINMSDRTIISTFLGLGANGLYAVANKFSNIFIQFYNIFNMTWTESVAMNIDDNESEKFFRDTINSMFSMFSAVCILIIGIMPFLFKVMVNKQYNDAYNQIPILMLATLFNVIIGLYSAFYIGKKMTGEVAKTSVISAIINISLNLLLLKYIGLYAASLSTAISFFIMMVYRYFDVKKIINAPLKKKNLFLVIMSLFITVYSYYICPVYIQLIILLVDVGVCILINKDILLIIFKQILRRVYGRKKVIIDGKGETL